MEDGIRAKIISLFNEQKSIILAKEKEFKEIFLQHPQLKTFVEHNFEQSLFSTRYDIEKFQYLRLLKIIILSLLNKCKHEYIIDKGFYYHGSTWEYQMHSFSNDDVPTSEDKGEYKKFYCLDCGEKIKVDKSDVLNFIKQHNVVMNIPVTFSRAIDVVNSDNIRDEYLNLLLDNTSEQAVKLLK